MVATGLFELVCFGSILWRYRRQFAGQLIAGLLFLLAVFQLAEYQVCTSRLGMAGSWSRLGFVAITLLPVLSLHLIYVMTGRWRRLLGLAYITAAPWLVLFLVPNAFNGNICQGNYVIFQLRQAYNYPYLIYYYFWLGVGLMLCFHGYKHLNGRVRPALRWLGVGYLAFILPTLLANTFLPQTLYAIPSVMCGFAIVYALILTTRVAPLLLQAADN